MAASTYENPRTQLIGKISPEYAPPLLPSFVLKYISSPATVVEESMRLANSILAHAAQYKPKAIANVMYHTISRMQKHAESLEGGLWAEGPNSLLVEYSNW
ncbi:hypothetical protein HZC27_00770 [Candidatus Roizmanbacteria bacterium]|nr:hypothetical protein [Candidatus Roizmanbacteria bacterium]